MTVTEQERRTSKRIKLDWPVSLWHGPTERFYSACNVNISSTGALVEVPLTVPVRISDSVQFSFLPSEVKKTDESPAKVFSGQVVRVNRGQSILQGYQSVALKFEPAT